MEEPGLASLDPLLRRALPVRPLRRTRLRDERLEHGRGRRIPGAQFIELDSRNHVLLEGEPAWGRFCEAVLDFVGLAAPAPRGDQAFDALSPRERAILGLLAEGLANAEIAERLAISEKTVRNHLSNVFDKLGVWTRARAIVFARDRGFRE